VLRDRDARAARLQRRGQRLETVAAPGHDDQIESLRAESARERSSEA
jgi:hypothetical protein